LNNSTNKQSENPHVEVIQNNNSPKSTTEIYQNFIEKSGKKVIITSNTSEDMISILEDAFRMVNINDGNTVSLSIEGKPINTYKIYKIHKNDLLLTSDRDIDIHKAEMIEIKDTFYIEPSYICIYIYHENFESDFFKEVTIYYAFLVKYLLSCFLTKRKNNPPNTMYCIAFEGC
jgi:predicted Fe-Mo cluster-binding NifX family protein